MKKIFLLIVLFSQIQFTNLYSDENTVSIVLKINEAIITNQDIVKEAKYLKALNTELSEVPDEQLNKLAKNSLIRETIKKNEIEKFYKMNYESTEIDPFIKQMISNLNLMNEDEFQNYLSNYDLTIIEVKKKLVIEKTWNQLIYERYKNKININKDLIEEKLDKLIRNKENEKSYLLYEIVFSEKTKVEYDKKYKDILSSIENIGFQRTAVIYSISDTSKSEGEIGWIKSSQISDEVLDKIKELKINEYSKPINSTGRTIILLVADKKEMKLKIQDRDQELSKIISMERNRQLKEFSILEYKKLENKAYVEKT